jgi:hypothetical protein
MFDKIKEFIQRGNDLGIPFPVFRDPTSGKGSISATLVFISSIAILVSLINPKINNSYAFDFFLASCSLYFGRKLTTKAGTSVDK